MVLDTTVARRLRTKTRFANDNSGYVSFDGASWMTVPDSPALSITGDISVAACVGPIWYFGLQHIVTKFNGTTNERSWRFSVNGSNQFEFVFSPDGTSTEVTISPVLPESITDVFVSSRIWVAVTVEIDDGSGFRVTRFWLSDDGLTWELFSTHGGNGAGYPSAPIFDSDANLVIGAEDGYSFDTLAGQISDVVIWSGIGSDGEPDGTEVFRWTGNTITDVNALTLEAVTGQTITLDFDPGGFSFLVAPIVRGAPVERGSVNVTTIPGAPAVAATIATTNGEVGTSLGSNNSQPSPSGVTSGDLLLAYISHDSGNNSVIDASTGWYLLGEVEPSSNNHNHAVYARLADESSDDDLELTGTTQDYCCSILKIISHGVTDVTTDIPFAITGSSANGSANPPLLDTGDARDWLFITSGVIDNNNTGQVITDDPASYDNVTNQISDAGSTSATSLWVSERSTTATQIEDPGTYTNTSRPWMASTLAVPPLPAEPDVEVTTTTGMDWRLVIERLESTGSIVGMCTVGPAPTGDAFVGTLEWNDITSYWRGQEYFRGADEPFGRPRVGEITLTLDNRDNRFSPWTNYRTTRPGTIIRCGLVSAVDSRADGWLPMWTGRVSGWPVRRQAVRSDGIDAADNWVDVTLDEMLVELANVDENALPGVEGAGDDVTERVDRLLTAAVWRYGMISTVSPATSGFTLQSTDMALNRLAELYVAADSTDAIVRSDVTGAVIVTDSFFPYTMGNRLSEFSDDGTGIGTVRLSVIDDTPVGDVQVMAVNGDSVNINSDLEHVRNDARFTRVGGTQQPVEHSVSIGVFGRFTQPRTDLQCQNDTQVEDLGVLLVNTRGRTSIRVDAVDVTATGKGEYYLLLAAVDLDAFVQFTFDATRSGDFGVRSMLHTIRPLPGRVHWQCTYALDTLDLTGWPAGSILDPTS